MLGPVFAAFSFRSSVPSDSTRAADLVDNLMREPNMPDTMRRRILLVLTCAALSGAIVSAQAAGTPQQEHPDVVAAKVRSTGAEAFDFDVTVSSPYDTPQRYADAFRVVGKDGVVYGERILLHDHAGEQPFTRDLYGVRIPRSVRVVVVQARDQRFGYGGKALEVQLPGR